MSIDPLAFLDERQSDNESSDYSSGSQNTESDDRLSFLDQKQPKSKFPDTFEEFLKSKPPKGRNIFADVITTGTSFAGLPGDIASIFTGDNPLTSENLRKKSFEAIPSLAPQNEEEKRWDEGLSTIMGLATPTGPLKAGAKLIGKGVSAAGGKAVSNALKGKYRELYDIGKNLGIDEKALAPFKQGKVSEWALKNLAKLGDTAKKGIDFAEKLASPLYNKLNEAGSKLPLNNIVTRSIIKDFQNIIGDINK
jgi:hypothetical protein